MSLFACEKCGALENTALCGVVWDEPLDTEIHPLDLPDPPVAIQRTRRRLLWCSCCNPDIGKWHGFFERVNAADAGYVRMYGSPYVAKPEYMNPPPLTPEAMAEHWRKLSS